MVKVIEGGITRRGGANVDSIFQDIPVKSTGGARVDAQRVADLSTHPG